MNKQEAFDTVVAEFAATMNISRRQRTSFTAVAKVGTAYHVNVRFGERDTITDEPQRVKVVVWQGPVLIHSGSWFPSATTAAKAAVAAVRDTGYIVQGELL